jgi:hypothetical protein
LIFKDINSKIREYCGQYLRNAGYEDMESGKTAPMPNTEIRQIESISENNVSSSLIDRTDNPGTDYPVCPVFPDSMSSYPAFLRYCPQYSLILLLMSLNLSL